MDQLRRSKIFSKFARIRLSDEIKELIETIGTRNLKETQLGNYVYRAKGEIRIGIRWYPATVSVKMLKEGLGVALSAPEANFEVVGPMDAQRFKERLEDAKEDALN